jgi:PAS domain S-box-containing protein
MTSSERAGSGSATAGPPSSDPSVAATPSTNASNGYQRLFTHNNAAMLKVDPASGKILDANEASARLYGWPVSTLLSMFIQDINCLPPDEVAAERRAAELENRNFFVFPHRIANGEIRTVEVHSTPVTTDGQTVLWSILHDVTDRRTAVERVRDLMAEKEAILGSDLIGITMVHDRRFVWANPEFARAFGYAAEELIGQSTRIIYPDEAGFSEAGTAAYPSLANRETYRMERQYRRKDGSIGWYAVSGTRVALDPAKSIWAFVDISRRKETEKRLNGERLRTSTILQTAADGIHVLDRAGTLVDANAAFLDMLGYDHDAIGHLNVKEWDASHQWGDIVGLVQSLIDSKGSLMTETVHRRREGRLLDVEINVRGITIDGVDYLYASSRDITERKRLATEVEDLYNRAPCGYHSLDEHGVFVRINDTELEWLGCSRDEVIGKKRPTDFFTEEGKATFERSYAKFLRDGQIHDLEFELVSRAGSTRCVSVSATLMRAPDGRMIHSRSVMHDITARKRADVQLRATRSELLRAQKIAQMGSWSWTPATGANIWSEEQYRIFGVCRSDFAPDHRSFMEAVHPADRELVAAFFDGVLTQGREFSRLQFRIVRPTGEIRHVRADAASQCDDHGAIVQLIGTVVDVTDFVDAQDRARVAGELLARELESTQFSERRMRSILDALSEGIVLMDRDGCIVDVNPAAEVILGLSRSQLLDPDPAGRTLAAVHEDGTAYPIEQHPITLALATCKTIRNEPMGLMVPGVGLRWVSVTAEPIFAPNDSIRPALAVATFVDVTEQRKAQESLRRSEAQQALALQGSREGLWDWDLPTNRVYFSDGWKRLLGYKGDEVGDGLEEWSGRVHPDDLEETLRLVRDHMEGRTALYESEHRMRHKDGQYVWILDRGMAFERDQSGAPKRMVGTHFDLSDRKRIESDLAAAKQTLELALSAGKMGVASRTLDGKVLIWDARMDELFDVPTDVRARGVDVAFWESRVHPADQVKIAEVSATGLQTGEPVEATFRVMIPNGEVRHIHGAMISPVEASERRMVIVHRDVTAKIRAEHDLSEARAEAERANLALKGHQAELEATVAQRTAELAAAVDLAQSADRAKTAFLATTSHELRTPLNSIIGFSQLLVDGAMGPVNEEQRRALTVVHRSGEQQLALVKDILDFTVIESGRLQFDIGDLNLRTLLEEQCEAIGLRAREHGLVIQPVDCDAAITSRADKARLEQVIRNLLSNAMTFTDQGQVAVRARVVDAMARVEVQDTGIGIPADQLDRLFKPFSPIEGQPGPRREKTGLGLALCRRIVEAMGGTIGVESAAGRGSTFWFTVPLSARATSMDIEDV